MCKTTIFFLFTTLFQPLDWVVAAPVQADSKQIPANHSTSSDHLNQLNKCREGIMDENARPQDRRHWVELLFSYRSDHAMEMIVELLLQSHQPEVQQVLCEVLRIQMRNHPELLNPVFFDPLLKLLGAQQAELRQASSLALSEFMDKALTIRLGQIAADDHEPKIKRMAAIDSLAPNTHRREVVQQLIRLLDMNDVEIISHVMVSLEQASSATIGQKSERWRLWWIENSQLSNEDWLQQQLQIYRDRWRRLADEYAVYDQQSRVERDAITAQTQHFQRELFRADSPQQRSVRLLEWLDDSLPVVQITALEMIKARIADEGKRPEGEVLATLHRLLDHSSPFIRREVLLIVQTMNDAISVHAVLKRLDQEKDPNTRLALLRAVGKLKPPQAVSALIKEIANQSAALECVAEASIALGEIVAQHKEVLLHDNPVSAIKKRYQSISAEDIELRAALLSAMAGIADSLFRNELLGAIESDDPNILQPTIRGLGAIGDRSQLVRFRSLMGHDDPMVRLAATEAVGDLGKEDADLETILTRLKSSVESNALVRQAAWQGLVSFMRRRPTTERIYASLRLRNTPELEIRYLENLLEDFSATHTDPVDQEKVLDRLTKLLFRQKKYTQAIPHFHRLYQMKLERKDHFAQNIGLRWLTTILHGAGSDEISDVIIQLRQSVKEDDQFNIMQTIIVYMDSPEMVGDHDRTRIMVEILQSIPIGSWGDPWLQAMSRWRDRATPSVSDPSRQQ